ncbi:hypothetical protein [Rhodopirellula sp. P2]|uniref:hypothetical protein n=1 Tax=Rhodopirellula sp. P2 TaxID=2127060 RepID=UPI002367E8B3|nr:hypothetical protein [Rhodopirellula sp. P2]WDQ18131.1 hypothetical protein PSR62_06135 [Rhodopirellula sp. P2]
MPIVPDRSIPLVDDQRQHRRIMRLALGVCDSEVATSEPCHVDWGDKEPVLIQRGVLMSSLTPSLPGKGK